MSLEEPLEPPGEQTQAGEATTAEGGHRRAQAGDVHVPELDTELVVEAEWEWSMAGDVDVDELVLVPSSVVFLKKLCCRA